ncbi:MAG: hypothetical protein CMJ78_14720 [Planctomycetaceae bacterium]|nr:hypothetical protein [Planctomycetaceae bacterium]
MSRLGLVIVVFAASALPQNLEAGLPLPWSQPNATKPSLLSRLTPSFLKRRQVSHSNTQPDATVRGQNREEWYAQRATDAPGSRQRYWQGKYWPPQPRPTGRAQLLSHRFHTAHYWSHPYICHDRAIVAKLSELQVNNGWVTETTLYDYHFDQDTHELNRAGRERLLWILVNAPRKYRSVFVQTGRSDAESLRRMTSVRTEATAMIGGRDMAPIMARNTQPLGRPAAEVQNIRAIELESQLPPRISSPLGQSAEPGG